MTEHSGRRKASVTKSICTLSKLYNIDTVRYAARRQLVRRPVEVDDCNQMVERVLYGQLHARSEALHEKTWVDGIEMMEQGLQKT